MEDNNNKERTYGKVAGVGGVLGAVCLFGMVCGMGLESGMINHYRLRNLGDLNNDKREDFLAYFPGNEEQGTVFLSQEDGTYLSLEDYTKQKKEEVDERSNQIKSKLEAEVRGEK